ncbi:XRE family transcriptional regulator [Curtobacterium sp. UCD-KPL2560]|uniref:helix-turn-helix domain-containing protein n=1 Tax=Curtobacterium sp. UCD-KPL2560 TaxID=1885315 RepID=UPI000A87CC4E|nr:XRE family transcriptional regulator [Curtobacterium sp. UCD-KPL2560]
MAPAPSRVPVDASQLLRHARRRAGLTQVQLAERAGVTQSVISTYENGRREPSLAALQRLLHAAGFDAVVDLRPAPAEPSLRDRLAAVRDDLLAVVAECGASNPRLFGSVARGEDGPGSDVDLMVDLPPDSGIFCLLRIQDAAERLLGVRVDVADAAGLRGSALREAVPL